MKKLVDINPRIWQEFKAVAVMRDESVSKAVERALQGEINRFFGYAARNERKALARKGGGNGQ